MRKSPWWIVLVLVAMLVVSCVGTGCRPKGADWQAAITMLMATVVQPALDQANAQVKAEMAKEGLVDPATGKGSFDFDNPEPFLRHYVKACLKAVQDAVASKAEEAKARAQAVP